MSKKAQSQIITTVLIILLVLAAIVIVWQVVNTTVRGGAEEVEAQAGCIGVNMVVVSADSATGDVVVRRDPGATDVASVTPIIFVNGANNITGTTALAQLDSDTITVSGLATGEEVQVAAKLADGSVCPLGTVLEAA